MLTLGERIDSYLILEFCGGGVFGSVYKAQDERSGEIFALKLCNGLEISRFKDENQILHTLHPHKNIIIPHSVIVESTPPHIYYVMELADSSLGDLLLSVEGNISDKRKIDIFYEICDGLKHAHSKDIIHRDLHWDNVLIVRKKEIKINDFGLAKEFYTLRNANSTTPQWGWIVSPPEFRFNIFEHSEDIKELILGDIYALGMILYYLFGDTPPNNYVAEMDNSIRKFSSQRGMKLNEIEDFERKKVYREWVRTFIPSKKLIISSIKDDKTSENINKIIQKATALEYNERYQGINDILSDVQNIFT